MRADGVFFCATLLLSALASQAQSLKPDAPLQASIEAIANAHAGHLTLYAEDLNTGRTVALDPDRKVPTASVIKLAILFEALEQVRAGKAHFGDRLTLNKQDQVQGSGVLLFYDTPMQLTLKDALTMMVVMSDNTGTNLVIDHLGLANINNRVESLGLHDTYLFKKVFSNAPQPIPASREPDHKTFGLGVTTAREMATVIKHIYGCELGKPGEPSSDTDRKICAVAVKMLGNQFYRDAIPRYLDGWSAPGAGDGPAIGNKTGSLDQVRNDVAVIAGKHGPIVVSAFTFDNKDQSWTVDNEAELTIAKVASTIAHAWSPEGLVPLTTYAGQPAN